MQGYFKTKTVLKAFVFEVRGDDNNDSDLDILMNWITPSISA